MRILTLNIFRIGYCFSAQILYAAQCLAQYPSSKIARENLEVFADAWESQINDLSILVKEVNDVCQGRGEKVVYLSLPRPGVSIENCSDYLIPSSTHLHFMSTN